MCNLPEGPSKGRDPCGRAHGTYEIEKYEWVSIKPPGTNSIYLRPARRRRNLY
jgi:hypothetical protein